MLAAACTGEIEPPASPLVNDTQLGLADTPDTAGSAPEEKSLPGLPNKVTIQRDANGAPHIKARTEREGYAALCYAEAQDRLFFLDSLRRNAQGRLAEIFGAGEEGEILRGDRLARVINLPKLAADRLPKMSAASQELLQACATGINAFIDEAKAKNTLPLEFMALGYQPDAWKAADSLAISQSIANNLDTGIYLTKLAYTAIYYRTSGDIAAALVPPPPALSMFDAKGKLNPVNQFVSAPGRGGTRRPNNVSRPRRGDWRPPQRRSTGWGEGTGPESNNYAVDGQLTATGHPLVANDPHLPLTTPSLAYAAQLTVDKDINGRRLNVEGITFPGFPLFVSGRTNTTSWAITFMLLDDVDLYSETITDAPGGGKQVVYKGNQVPVETRDEEIQIFGSEPLRITVLKTPHGPVLNAADENFDAFGQISLKSTIFEPTWSIEGLINLPRTSNWAQFQASARSCSIGFNFLFSDETGNKGRIGYQASGLVPLRQSPDNAFAVVEGSDGSHEWLGFANPNELPSVYDPPAHVLATGNNRIVPDDFKPGNQPIYLTNYYDTPWRAQRLYTRLLKNSGAFNISDFASIQLDTLSVVNPSLRDTFVKAITSAGQPTDATSVAAFNALKSWDGSADSNSKGAAIYETLLFTLMADTAFAVIKDPAVYAAYASSVFVTQQQQALRDLLESPRAPFFGIVAGANDAASKRDSAVKAAFTKAVALLKKDLGDVSKWTWGGVHTLTYNHPLAESAGPPFTIGTFPAKGDAATPLIGGFFIHAGQLAFADPASPAKGAVTGALWQDALQVVRAVWEPSSNARSLVTLSTGESGVPGTAHYADQAKAWRDGRYLQMPFAQ